MQVSAAGDRHDLRGDRIVTENRIPLYYMIDVFENMDNKVSMNGIFDSLKIC